MNVRNTIASWLMSGFAKIGREDGSSFFPDFFEERQSFANAIFTNIVELLTDLVDDTTLVLKSGNSMLFAELKSFFENDGQIVLNRIFDKGFAVIAYNTSGFSLLDSDQYTTDAKGIVSATSRKHKGSRIYIMKSNSYRESGKSAKAIVGGFLKYLENILNASNTTTARLGTMIMATPQTPSGVNSIARIQDDEKKEYEDDISLNYGALKSQRQIFIWKQQMGFTTINLSGMDAKTIEKAKFAINVICDRVKVPSNQVSVIDASNTNSLSNGGEMREGDLLKYKSFERLMERTFVKMARDLELKIDFTVYNKPDQTPAQPIAQ